VKNETRNGLTDEERALIGCYGVASDLAARCRQLREMNAGAYSDDVLGHVVNTLMTVFWDEFFSQTEIRRAFTDALDDMNRYAGGEERRR
jgi:hypothetical protein